MSLQVQVDDEELENHYNNLNEDTNNAGDIYASESPVDTDDLEVGLADGDGDGDGDGDDDSDGDGNNDGDGDDDGDGDSELQVECD